jgi:hypothetical protein
MRSRLLYITPGPVVITTGFMGTLVAGLAGEAVVCSRGQACVLGSLATLASLARLEQDYGLSGFGAAT